MILTYKNALGAGFAERVEVPDGKTLREFLTDRGHEPGESMISVNGSPATADHVLSAGEYVTVTPINVKMA